MNTQTAIPLAHELLRARATIKDERIADAIGKDASNVSRIFSNSQGVLLDDLESLLRVLGYQVVKADAVPVDADYLESMRLFAATGINCRCARRGEGFCR